jgi:hypothetical protein
MLLLGPSREVDGYFTFSSRDDDSFAGKLADGALVIVVDGIVIVKDGWE